MADRYGSGGSRSSYAAPNPGLHEDNLPNFDVIAVASGIAGLILGALIVALLGGKSRSVRHVAEARLQDSQAQAIALEAELRAARDAESQAALAANAARQRVEALQDQVAAWEEAKGKFLEMTKAGVLETAQHLSSKLIDDHKRETNAAKLDAEIKLRATADQLKQEVKVLGDGVAELKGQVAEKGAIVDTVWRALTSPGGAGYYAEIGLSNTLRSFGLHERRDYVLQETIYGEEAERRLRPDAIVFLPRDAVLVIDAKASKHLLDIARGIEGGLDQAAALEGLKRTMNTHLRGLCERDYAAAVRAGCRKSGRMGDIARVITVMYLPNEVALERLAQADPDFNHKAAKAEIIPAGPAGLASIIGFAASEISFVRQIENQEAIIRGTERLVESLSISLGHVASIGKGIKQAADGFVRLTTDG